MNSLLARIAGVLFAPRATFRTLVRVPLWADVLVLTFVVSTLCTVALLETDVGQLALLDQWERTAAAFGRNVDDVTYAALEEASRNDAAVYAIVTSFAAGPMLVFGLSALFFAAFRAAAFAEGSGEPRPSSNERRRAGTDVAFKQVLAVVSHAGVILTLRQLIAAPLMYARETLASPVTIGLFFSMLNEASPIARFAGIVDLFVIWWIVVLAMGVAALYRRSARGLALVFVGVYIMLAAILAVVMAATGGTA